METPPVAGGARRGEQRAAGRGPGVGGGRGGEGAGAPRGRGGTRGLSPAGLAGHWNPPLQLPPSWVAPGRGDPEGARGSGGHSLGVTGARRPSRVFQQLFCSRRVAPKLPLPRPGGSGPWIRTPCAQVAPAASRGKPRVPLERASHPEFPARPHGLSRPRRISGSPGLAWGWSGGDWEVEPDGPSSNPCATSGNSWAILSKLLNNIRGSVSSLSSRKCWQNFWATRGDTSNT